LDTAPIRILNLSNNNIEDKGATYLADVIRFKRTLIQLNLSGNLITDKGVESLANALSHPQANLETLDLQNNRRINDSSVQHLIDMINQSRSLNTLCLKDCGFNNQSRQRLRDAADSKGNRFQLIIESSN
jgi:Ran GTPase-activating protein (RanGAP) involved in mRNA processing and transport